MASKTLVYLATLLMWLTVAAAIGYSGVSKANELLANITVSQDLHRDLMGMVSSGSDDKNTYSFNWELLDSWNPDLLAAK